MCSNIINKAALIYDNALENKVYFINYKRGVMGVL